MGLRVYRVLNSVGPGLGWGAFDFALELTRLN